MAAGKARYEANKHQATESSKQWRHRNPEKRRAITARWREGNRERIRAYEKARREANPEKVARAVAASIAKKRDYYNELARHWRQQNPEVVRAIVRRRYARQRGAQGSYTAGEWEALVESYCGLCVYCGRPAERLTADHIIPLAAGGTNDIDNIVPACGHCNSSKNARPLLVFLVRRAAA